MSNASQARYNRDDGWGRSSRFYPCPDGVDRVSVTTVIGVLAKPALIGWAAKEERNLVLDAAAEFLVESKEVVNPREYRKFLEARLGAQKAHVKKLRAATDIGSAVHEKIEWTLRGELQQAVGPEPQLEGAALWAFMAWEDWRKSVNLVPVQIEQMVYSVKHGYAGTLDLFAEMDLPTGQRGMAVLDWKTSKALYPESSLQSAAYAEALIEMGHAEHPLWGCVVRLPKLETDPAFEVKFLAPKEQGEAFKSFRAAAYLWRWMDKSHG
jgi:hypothetical protein